MSNYQSGSIGNGSSDTAGIGQRVGQIGTDAQQVLSDARGAVADLSSTLDIKGRVQRNPYATLAIAAGVGYVLGGGLFTGLTARIVRLGIKLAAVPLVKDELLGFAESAMSGFSAGSGKSSGSTGSTSV